MWECGRGEKGGGDAARTHADTYFSNVDHMQHYFFLMKARYKRLLIKSRSPVVKTAADLLTAQRKVRAEHSGVWCLLFWGHLVLAGFGALASSLSLLANRSMD